jgi:hypothetical protein
MSLYASLYKSPESFASRVQDLNVNITKHIQESNVQYKLQTNLYMHHNEYSIRDYIMIQ